MEIFHIASMTSSIIRDERIFLYEVFIPSQPGEYRQRSLYCSRKFYWRVSYSQMSTVMRRIALLGGKIISITPASPEETIKVNSVSSLPWWVEILTTQPRCLYYFGPFASSEEAQSHQMGFVEDLQAESSQGISVQVKQCQPNILTQEC